MPDESARLAGVAAALLATEPRLGGALLVGGDALPVRAWIDHLRELRGAEAPHRRVPLGVASAALLGGIDIPASLTAGRRVVNRGIIAGAHGGVLSMPLVELQDASVVSMVAAAIDDRVVRIERDGVSDIQAADVIVVAMTRPTEGDAHAPSASLLDRLALTLEIPASWPTEWHFATPARIAAAQRDVHAVEASARDVSALCAAAATLGIGSMRAIQHAVRAARAHAALCGRLQLSVHDVDVAIALVLAPRAAVPPVEVRQDTSDATNTHDAPSNAASPADLEGQPTEEALVPQEDIDVEAIEAAVPVDFIRQMAERVAVARRTTERGRSGRRQAGLRHGRPIGARPGDPRRGVVDLHATLLAAAPWSAARSARSTEGNRRPQVRPADLRVRRFIEPTVRTIVFAVDASGSLARSRLAEAKGAIELLLAASYSRRDRACLIAFRGTSATCVLPPTRALARARRELAAMAAGGATPLAAGLDLARDTCERVRRESGDVRLVVVTDGGANIARSGEAGRAAAGADVSDAARRLRSLGVETLLIDASPRGADAARSLAALLGARHVHLGRPDARRLHAAVHFGAATTAGAT